MMLTLTLAVGLLAAPEPQADPPNGWVAGLHGFTYHLKAKPEAWIIEDPWIIELRDFKKHPQAEAQKSWIIQFPHAKPQPEPVEGQYHDDLSAFFEQFKMQRQAEAVEGDYVDDLPAFFKQLKKL